MHITEILFLGGFVVFITAILLLDMLVIDRKAHVVSIKEAASWTGVWIALALLFSVFLWFHGDMVHGIHTFSDLQEVSGRYAAHIRLDPSDFEGSLQKYRHYMTISYISGYLIEKTLSVDNLFVMMMIFASFGVSKMEYQRVLNWGILGAIVLRFIFIFIGAAIINKFDWVLLIFGVFLVYSGVKMYLDRNKKEQIDVEHHPMVKFLSRHFNVYPKFAGDKFFVRAHRVNDKELELVSHSAEISDTDNKKVHNKKSRALLCMTPLFVTVLVIEFSDLIFAFDSIPAVFSVSLDPYVVFFSNIFAILGLRAMFFLLAAITDKFRYLKIGVSVLLLFIGIKLLIHEYVEIDSVMSLVFILAVLVVSIALSLMIPQKKNE